jgi:hypothetical protein
MGFVIGLLVVAIVVSTALTLRAVAGLRSHVTERCNSLADLQAELCKLTTGQAAEIAEENLLQHRIGRKYIGVDLIEGKLLPHVGYRPPEKTPVEKWMLRTWRKEVDGEDDGQEHNPISGL